MVAPLGRSTFGGLVGADTTVLEQLKIQLVGSIAVIIWCGLITTVIILVLKNTIGIRVSSDDEEKGLDQSTHAERAYHN